MSGRIKAVIIVAGDPADMRYIAIYIAQELLAVIIADLQ